MCVCLYGVGMHYVVSWLAACMIVKGVDYVQGYIYSSLLLSSQPFHKPKVAV